MDFDAEKALGMVQAFVRLVNPEEAGDRMMTGSFCSQIQQAAGATAAVIQYLTMQTAAGLKTPENAIQDTSVMIGGLVAVVYELGYQRGRAERIEFVVGGELRPPSNPQEED